MLPREHGGWVMLYAPLIVGVSQGQTIRLDVLALALAVTAVYGVRVPAASLLLGRQGERYLARLWLVGYALAAAIGALGLAGHPNRWRLLVVAAAGAFLFVVHFVLSVRREHRGAAAELLGVAGLSLTAPLGYLVAGGDSWSGAAVLWALHFAFFGSSVFYVKWRVAQLMASRRGVATGGSFVALVAYQAAAAAGLVALAAYGVMPWAALAGYGVLALRYILPLVVRRPPTLTHVGISEIVISALFVCALIWAL
jgi:hypothetical protein